MRATTTHCGCPAGACSFSRASRRSASPLPGVAAAARRECADRGCFSTAGPDHHYRRIARSPRAMSTPRPALGCRNSRAGPTRRKSGRSSNSSTSSNVGRGRRCYYAAGPANSRRRRTSTSPRRRAQERSAPGAVAGGSSPLRLLLAHRHLTIRPSLLLFVATTAAPSFRPLRAVSDMAWCPAHHLSCGAEPCSPLPSVARYVHC